MKKLNINGKEWLLSILVSLAVIVILLITSFEVATYSDWSFYQKEYEKYEVAEDLTMEMPDIMETTKYMMSYLRGNEEELRFITTIDGEEMDFFNEQDRFHMGEVRDLFLGGLLLRRIAIIIILAAALGFFLMKSSWRAFLPQVYGRTLGILAVGIGVLGVLIAQNFSEVFVVFHHIFFDNDLWLFDPTTDYMIRMLPEGFFFDIVLRIGSIFIGALAVSLLVCFLISKTYKRNEI